MNQKFNEENGKLLAEVTFGEEEIRKATDKAVIRLCENVTVQGFRKGKAPIDVARRYIRGNDLANETIDQLLRMIDKNFSKLEEFNKYLKDNRLMNGFRPKVDIAKFSDKEAEIKIAYVLRPVCSKLGNYKGLKADVEKKTVTDADVDAEIKRLAADEAELVPADKAAEMGDTVNLDFTGLMNGEPFEGGSSKGFDLELGSGRFVPGFEEQCVSHKAGDKFDVRLTMPENYPEPLTGKNVVFKVVLNAVKTKEVPEVNDDFATTLSGQYVSKDLAELKGKVKVNLEKSAETAYNNAILNNLLNQIRDASEFVIADEYLVSEVNRRADSDNDNLSRQGLTLEEYLKLINKTEEDYRAELRAGIESELRGSLVYDALVEAEKIAMPTNTDIEARLGTKLDEFVKNYTNYLKSQKMDQGQINDQINGYLNQIFSSILTERVQARVLELNGYKKAEEPAKEDAKVDEAKADEVKADEAKADEVKADEVKAA